MKPHSPPSAASLSITPTGLRLDAPCPPRSASGGSPKTRSSQRSRLALALVFLVSACTTVDDFRKMSPAERASRVCNRQQNIKSLVTERDRLATAIQATQADLGRGYKVHRQCSQVKVYGNPTTSCQKAGNQINCTEYRPESYTTQCQELPVSLNAELEKEKIQSWSIAHQDTVQRLQFEWQKCNESMVRLTPEEAYEHYR